MSDRRYIHCKDMKADRDNAIYTESMMDIQTANT